jgi:hypothetical protein
MQPICTVSVETLETGDDGRGKTYSSLFKKHESQSLHSRFLGVSFVASLKSNLRTLLTTQNTTEYTFIISHSQNTTALKPNVLLIGIRGLLDTNKGRSAFRSSDKNFNGELQTSHAV